MRCPPGVEPSCGDRNLSSYCINYALEGPLLKPMGPPPHQHCTRPGGMGINSPLTHTPPHTHIGVSSQHSAPNEGFSLTSGQNEGLLPDIWPKWGLLPDIWPKWGLLPDIWPKLGLLPDIWPKWRLLPDIWPKLGLLPGIWPKWGLLPDIWPL